MKQLLEFIPLILFFVVYKLAGIREAAIALIIATIFQMLILKLKYGKIEKQQIIMGIAVVFFGTLTAYFNKVEYLQWKVTIVYALFALILLISQYGFKKPLIEKLLGKEIQLPEKIWNKLNLAWAGFFILCMLINIYISQYCSEEVWVDFKSFGIIAMTFIATLFTGIYVYRYLPKDDQNK
ncbi:MULTISPECIES: septation protein A [Basfia]|uniref:Inner membrane-spanning protein YciB n=2 Tax=Basfia TaxID=697331 RepID=YCIB_MANSM|nr:MULTISPECIES: septation protein A [Basfia]Q65UL6.1 RecName: Full=Inner membrane-spanning protein YciB [[Mannheimia] succiniciproducens MBEL55E]AAU37344.1 unknown [[Mannheimia] succiniciproducens MBEL55E]QIM68167.1 septation protein A [Basfia succiniciproducens]SCX94874.1 intracellular septation protein [Basfia succiniciproducens]SEQ78332.1 intracellular septation protein [Basfia succiniciproducens]